jgi:predicted ABC-type exoprotein transport system permease subunit
MWNDGGRLVGYNKRVCQVMHRVNNNHNNRIGGSFVFFIVLKCLPFFIYQHIETLVSQEKEFLLLKYVPALYGVLMCD